MKRSPIGRIGPQDLENTDTLPMPVFEDTGTFVMPAIAAIPVSAPDLAESLREHEQRLEISTRRVAELEAGLLATNRRCNELLRECVELRLTTVPKTATDADAGAAPRVIELEAELVTLRQQNVRLHEALSTVQGQLAVRDGMLDEAERALRAAPRGQHTPAQSDHEEWRVRCAELSFELESERATAVERGQLQEARLSALEVELDALRVRLLAPAVADRDSWHAAQPRPNASVLRVLVREEGGAEVVYPLGRHTSIGRTPDNDIQVDATYVSRNHAMLLAGTEHCIVEDLNSTNGVLVNGHKVDRQVLHDGDTLTIGKTHFRYQQRS